MQAHSTFAGFPKYLVTGLLNTFGWPKKMRQQTPKLSPIAMIVPTTSGLTDHTLFQYNALMANCVEIPNVVKKKQATTVPKNPLVFITGGVDALITFPDDALLLVSLSSSKISTASMLYVLTRVLTPAFFPPMLARLFLPLGAFSSHSAKMSPKRMSDFL